MNKLGKLFRRSVGGLALMAGIGAGAVATTGRPLTTGEKEMIEDHLGPGEVPVDDVRLHTYSKSLFGKGGWALGNHVWMFGEGVAPDYSKTDSIRQGLFMHEMTHAGQFHRDFIGTELKALGAMPAYITGDNTLYEFEMEQKTLGHEQEASLVQTYMEWCRRPGCDLGEQTGWGPDMRAAVKKLSPAMARAFPNGREARHAGQQTTAALTAKPLKHTL